MSRIPAAGLPGGEVDGEVACVVSAISPSWAGTDKEVPHLVQKAEPSPFVEPQEGQNICELPRSLSSFGLELTSFRP